MILDYIDSTDNYVIRLPRDEASTIRHLMKVDGLNFSTSASTNSEAVLYTDTPYSALSYFDHGTERAKQNLQMMHRLSARSLPVSIDHRWEVNFRASRSKTRSNICHFATTTSLPD